MLGTIPGWLTLATLLGAAWAFRRGGGGAAIQNLETANRVLERSGEQKDKQINELLRRVALLETKTDFAIAFKPIIDWTAAHEMRAEARHDKTMIVMDLIAKRMGAEPDTA